MKRFYLTPMVYDHVDKTGIWWKGSKDGLMYVFYWNPLRVLVTLFGGNCHFGFLPFKTSHLKLLRKKYILELVNHDDILCDELQSYDEAEYCKKEKV